MLPLMSEVPENEERWALADLTLRSVAPPARDGKSGFLGVLRHRLQIVVAGGQASEAFAYDEIARRAMDAVVIAAHFHRSGEPWVFLRSALRPPPALAQDLGRARLTSAGGQLWELPAGLVEAEESGGEGPVRAARRELLEELGFSAAEASFHALGPPTLPCPGALAERQYFFRIEVDPDERREPTLDGSALEHHGRVTVAPLREALRRCEQGGLPDAKTELALRRLLQFLRQEAP